MATAALRGVLLPAVLVLALVAGVSLVNDIPMYKITRDVAALGKLHPLAGALSSLGAFVWCAAGAVSLFTAYLVRSSDQPDLQRFFAWSGTLSLYLLADDFFQIHEDLAARYLGMDESILLAILGAAVAFYLVQFRNIILRTRYALLIASLCLLAGSALVDTVFARIIWRLGHWTFFLEDGLKWLGIVAWCGYHCSAASQFLGALQKQVPSVGRGSGR